MNARFTVAASGELEIEGALDIRSADAFKEAILAKIREGSGLAIQMRGVTQCDLAALQLLYSARSSTQSAKQPFKILNPPRCLHEACVGAGIDPLLITDTNAH